MCVSLHASASHSSSILPTRFANERMLDGDQLRVRRCKMCLSEKRADKKRRRDRIRERDEEGVTQLGHLLPKLQIKDVTGGRI